MMTKTTDNPVIVTSESVVSPPSALTAGIPPETTPKPAKKQAAIKGVSQPTLVPASAPLTDPTPEELAAHSHQPREFWGSAPIPTATPQPPNVQVMDTDADSSYDRCAVYFETGEIVYKPNPHFLELLKARNRASNGNIAHVLQMRILDPAFIAYFF